MIRVGVTVCTRGCRTSLYLIKQKDGMVFAGIGRKQVKTIQHLVDYFVPQLYGAAGTLPPEWRDYVHYWTSGAGKPNVHNVTFAKIPMQKIVWGMPYGTCDQGKPFGGSGCVEWAYSAGVKPHVAATSEMAIHV